MPRAAPDVVGKRFGKLVITAWTGGVPNCLAQCDCGKTVHIRLEWLTRSDPVRSCGCVKYKGGTRRKINVKHQHASDRMGGRGASKFYKAWAYIKLRTSKPDYGAEMDPRWASFENFLSDVPMHPEENGERWSLTRIDDGDDWHKDNVEWLPASERARRLMLKHIHGVE